MPHLRPLVVLLVLLLVASCSGGPAGDRPEPVRVGAIYPLSGTQGMGGIDEYHGVRAAAVLINADGGIGGRPVVLDEVDVPEADAAPGAIRELADRGVDLVLGSYGSTISSPAATAAAGAGSLFWETGAVGKLAGPGEGELVFRVAPTGGLLGRGAIRFVADQLAPKLGRPADSLRFAIAAVDDVYGAAVADGARAELRDRDLETVADVAYDPRRYDPAKVIAEIAAARPDVLFVVAYLEDGVALRKEQVRQHLPLLASIGTSSSYCMPEFGALLGKDAVGLFASDKPDTHGINPAGLAPDARALLDRADAAYREANGHSMSAAALAGFSGAWALFRHVLPDASSMAPADVAAAARRARVPAGGLPNGSGIEFAPAGGADAGANLRAASVIWEWTQVNRREVTWPPQFATAEIAAIRPSR
ncbi:MAG TPA: ABC transporter substrate-binding protein [Actinomycetota bacterium]|nr:ABC transporter substrate-binding protein [Actinomycetota bacterium]